MVLPFLIPIIGAAIGGGIAASVGGAILTGMSIGWMVGSWLFPMGGDSGIEPTAANLQDVNQSLRGADIPILFGTNRVQSSIILRDNFDTDKIKEKSGGFFGIGGSSQTVGYEYFLDLVLHYGIPYTNTGFQVFAGWRNDEIMSAAALARWTERASGDHPLVAESVYRGQITKFLNQPNGGAGRGLNYQDAHWSGGQPDTELWGHIDNLTDGFNVRWPHQVWAGFRNLKIEDNATIPAISLEIGPTGTNGALTPGTGDGLVSITSLNTSNKTPGRNLDKFGNTWLWGDDALRVISRSGTVLYSTGDSAWVGRMNAVTANSMFSTSTTRRGFKNVCPILNGEKVAVWFVTFTDPVDYQLSLSIVDPISAVGTPEIQGLVWCQDALQGATRGASRGFDHCHLQRENDPLIFHGGAEATLTAFYSYVFPDPAGIIAGAYINGYDASTVGLAHALATNTTAVYTSYEVPRIRYLLPTAADRDTTGAFWDGIGNERSHDFVFMLPMDRDGEVKTALWIPIVKGVHDFNVGGVNEWSAYTNSISKLTSAHLGGAVYYLYDNHHGNELTYDQLTPTSGSAGEKVWTFFTDTWVWASSHFLNADGQITMPFSDDEYTLAGAATANACYAPHPFFHKDDDSTWCFGWAKYYNTSADLLGNRRLPITIRGYIYDRGTARFTEFGHDTRSQTIARTTLATSLTTIDNNLWIGARITDDHQLELSFSDVNGHVFQADWGTFDCQVSSHTDLTPPEIIRHILTNSLYGLSFPSTRIHSSYDAAVAYCNTESFRVSAIYRTSEDRARYIEHLLATYGGFLNWSKGQLKFGFVTGSDSVVRTLDNAHFAVQNIGDVPLKVMKGSRQDTFNKIQVHYLDRRLAYRTNMVEIADEADIEETGVRVREFPARFVMSEEMASKMAHRTLWSNLFARDQYQGAIGWKDADLEPGDVVWLVDSHHPELDTGVRARITGIAENGPGFFVFNAVQEDPAFLNDPGFVTSETLASPGAGLEGAGVPIDFTAFETPQEFAPASEIYFALYPNHAILGSALYTSASSDGTFSLVVQNGNRPIAGRLGVALGNTTHFRHDGSLAFMPSSGHSANSPDYVYTVTFSSVLPTDRADGNAIFLCGSEVLAVESLTATGSNTYRVGRIYRGWGGTPVHAHNSGDIFYWLDEAILARPYVLTEVGKRIFYKVAEVDAFGEISDVTSITPKEYRIRGTWYGPQVSPPIHTWVVRTEAAPFSRDLRGLNVFGVGSGDGITFLWEHSARLAGFGAGAFGNAGFGHFTTDPSSQRWHVLITGSGGNAVRSLVVTTPAFVYTRSANVADNGAFGPFAIQVTAHNDVTSALRSHVKSCTVFER